MNKQEKGYISVEEFPGTQDGGSVKPDHHSTAELPRIPAASKSSNASAFDTLRMSTKALALNETNREEIAIKNEVLNTAKSLLKLLDDINNIKGFRPDESFSIYYNTVCSLIDSIKLRLSLKPLSERLKQPVVPMINELIRQYGDATSKREELESILDRFERSMDHIRVFKITRK